MAGGPESRLGSALWQPSRLLQGTSQEVLDLPVHAAELVLGPPFERFVDLGVDPDQEGFAFRHDALLIE